MISFDSLSILGTVHFFMSMGGLVGFGGGGGATRKKMALKGGGHEKKNGTKGGELPKKIE